MPQSELERVKTYFSKPNRFQKTRTVDAAASSHTFERFGRNYKCVKCGIVGKPLFEFPLSLEVKKYRECKPDILMNNLLQPEGEVKICRDLPDFGLKMGDVLKIVQCPVEYAEKYGDKVWVMSPTLKEPCRLLPREYSLLNQ